VSVRLIKQHPYDKIAVYRMRQTIRKLSVVSTSSKGITVGRGRNWGKKLMQHMLWIT